MCAHVPLFSGSMTLTQIQYLDIYISIRKQTEATYKTKQFSLPFTIFTRPRPYLFIYSMYISVSTSCLWFIIGESEIKIHHVVWLPMGKRKINNVHVLSEATTTTRSSSGIQICSFVFFLCYTVLLSYIIWIYKKAKERKEGTRLHHFSDQLYFLP